MPTPHEVTPLFYDHATMWTNDESLAGHSTDGGRVFGITRTSYAECERYGCAAVVVINPEDPGQVERAWATLRDGLALRSRVDMHAALARLIEPPQPEEPTGRFAAVLDSDGDEWVRLADASVLDGWLRVGGLPVDGEWTHYRDIAVVKVLSEGVQP